MSIGDFSRYFKEIEMRQKEFDRIFEKREFEQSSQITNKVQPKITEPETNPLLLLLED